MKSAGSALHKLALLNLALCFLQTVSKWFCFFQDGYDGNAPGLASDMGRRRVPGAKQAGKVHRQYSKLKRQHGKLKRKYSRLTREVSTQIGL